MLKRSDGVPGAAFVASGKVPGPAELKTVCFKGPETSAEVRVEREGRQSAHLHACLSATWASARYVRTCMPSCLADPGLTEPPSRWWRWCQVAGLVPNTFYEFRLRSSNARCASILSPPLHTMTPPNAPEGAATDRPLAGPSTDLLC